MFYIAVFLLVLAVGALIVRFGLRGAEQTIRDGWSVAAIALFGLTFLLMFVASVAIVGTKEVGIITTFNRPTGELDNGFHLIAPWQSVTEMDAAIQTDNNTDANHDCVSARIAHQIIACVDTTVRWRIQEPSADELFQDYRDFNNVRTSLVTREMATDINAIFQTYDPLAVDAKGNSDSPPLNMLAAQVQSKMQEQIGSRVEVLSVFIPVLHFDAATQSRINALQAQIAQTRIAQQAVLTAQEQAAANQALAASVSTSSNVLVSKCLDVLAEMVNKGQGVPAGFTCWPGGGTGVVIPSAAKQ